jgi:two-component system sensor histidine kinase TctE
MSFLDRLRAPWIPGLQRTGRWAPPAPRAEEQDEAELERELQQILPDEESAPDAPVPRSLFGEILDWMLAPLLLLWPLSIAVTYLAAKAIANGPFDRALETSAIVLSQQVREVNGRVVLQLPLSAKEILRADERDNIYFQVLGTRGEFITGDPDLPLPLDNEQPYSGLVHLRDEKLAGNDIRVAHTYINVPGLVDGAPVLVQVAETLDKRAQLANEIIKGVILPQFVILPLAVVLVWFGLARGLAPLTALQQRIHARNPRDTSPINERATPQEITPLVASFNEMLTRVEQSVNSQKRFIADAAHQMKTPLAGLRMQAELAQREQSPDELRRSLAHIASSSNRTAHLVKQLLALARMENADVNQTMASVDLTALTRDIVTGWLSKAWANKIDLGIEVPPTPTLILGNAMMLTEMLGNLIDNAIVYTPPGGHVTVRVHTLSSERHIVLEVDDTGPGIPPAERERVMERFYRILGSGIEGSGLGLSIVREIVQQHGGTIEILDHVYAFEPLQSGTRVRISLPRLPVRTGAEWS